MNTHFSGARRGPVVHACLEPGDGGEHGRHDQQRDAQPDEDSVYSHGPSIACGGRGFADASNKRGPGPRRTPARLRIFSERCSYKLAPFRQLHVWQSICRFSSVSDPPLLNGMMWSKWILCALPHWTHLPPSRAKTACFTARGIGGQGGLHAVRGGCVGGGAAPYRAINHHVANIAGKERIKKTGVSIAMARGTSWRGIHQPAPSATPSSSQLPLPRVPVSLLARHPPRCRTHPRITDPRGRAQDPLRLTPAKGPGARRTPAR